ncbi:hypothetical protein [Planosporangium mesophilum]|uniref:Lipoprotein n=1 Tax=Planosporangium mesophilum TaxID=689768 RepID=A0A8J3X151_9ACTN|nr:hypothetical protein [Planosporangium mesophilum]NJC84422.1 hypothetical protein [Planosporangium mesophilum]GII23436.1 hypothetical protein Pme01_30330 [Planosporangium mesophilum]
MRSLTIGTLALALTGALLLTSGCTGRGADGVNVAASNPTSTVAPSPTGTPAKDDLVAALKRTQAAPYRYTVESNLPENSSVSATGAFDPVGKVLDVTTTTTGGTAAGTTQRIVVGADTYLRPGGAKTWVHMDLSRVKKDNLLAYFDMTDPTGLATFTSALGFVERGGPHAYSGNFDPVSSDEFLPLGSHALFVFAGMAPFTATTDDQGRVVSIHIELPQRDGPKLVMTTTLSEHGKPLPITAPARANVQEAGDFVYR